MKSIANPLFIAIVGAAIIPTLLVRAGNDDTHVSKKIRSKSSKSRKSRKSSRNFLKFAMRELNDVNTIICAAEGYEEACGRIPQLVAAGEKYKVLPDYIYTNYRVMAIAYPIASGLITGDPISSALFVRVIRIHRALGLGNSQLYQGYSNAAVNELYWSNYDRLTILDEDIQPFSDGINIYCGYIANEYKTLKDFSVDNYDGANIFASLVTFDEDTIGFSWMNNWCLGLVPDNLVLSYIVRSDWEQHRSEVVGSMMNTAYTKKLVTHTIWHWESLFAAAALPGTDTSIQQLFQSFDVFLPADSP